MMSARVNEKERENPEQEKKARGGQTVGKELFHFRYTYRTTQKKRKKRCISPATRQKK